MYWYQPPYLTFLNIAFTVKLLFQVIMQHLDQEKSQRLPFFSAFLFCLYFCILGFMSRNLYKLSATFYQGMQFSHEYFFEHLDTTLNSRKLTTVTVQLFFVQPLVTKGLSKLPTWCDVKNKLLFAQTSLGLFTTSRHIFYLHNHVNVQNEMILSLCRVESVLLFICFCKEDSWGSYSE